MSGTDITTAYAVAGMAAAPYLPQRAGGQPHGAGRAGHSVPYPPAAAPTLRRASWFGNLGASRPQFVLGIAAAPAAPSRSHGGNGPGQTAIAILHDSHGLLVSSALYPRRLTFDYRKTVTRSFPRLAGANSCCHAIRAS